MAATEKSAAHKPGRAAMGSGRKRLPPAAPAEAASPEAAMAWISSGKGDETAGGRRKPGPSPKVLDTPVEPISIKIPKPLFTWLQRAAFKGKEDESPLSTQKDIAILGIYNVLKERYPDLQPADFHPSMIVGVDPD